MPQCNGICKGSGNRCRKHSRKGELTCSIKDHVCEENSVSDVVQNITSLPRDLANMIEKLVPQYQTRAYLIGGIDNNVYENIGYEDSLLAVPLSIDSITMDTNPSTDAVKLPQFHHIKDNNKDKWGGSDAMSCVLNGLIYVFGGRNDTDPLEVSSRKVATYHPLSDTWDTTTIPMIPGRCTWCSPVVIGFNIYVVGSDYNEGEYSEEKSMYMLDSNSRKWSQIQVTIPSMVQSSNMCSIDKVIYSFGTGLDKNNVFTFNTEATNPKWEVFFEINLPWSPDNTVVIKNKIFLFGSKYFYVFDVETKSCTKLASTCAGEDNPFLLDDERYIHVVNGLEIGTYDIENDRWLDEVVIFSSKERRFKFSIVTLPGWSCR
jgi:hypothetical protein